MTVDLIVLWFTIMHYTEYECSINSGAFSDEKQSFSVVFCLKKMNSRSSEKKSIDGEGLTISR